MNTKARDRKAQREADAFNALHPIGTSVRIWPGLREGEGIATVTSSEASVMCGTAVVWTEARPCIALTHTSPQSVEAQP